MNKILVFFVLFLAVGCSRGGSGSGSNGGGELPPKPQNCSWSDEDIVALNALILTAKDSSADVETAMLTLGVAIAASDNQKIKNISSNELQDLLPAIVSSLKGAGAMTKNKINKLCQE